MKQIQGYIMAHVPILKMEEDTYSGFCKLTLNNGTIVELEGEGELDRTMVQDYLSSVVEIELGPKCTSIGGVGCFAGSPNLNKLTIPNSIQSFGTYSFMNCPIKTLIIDNNQAVSGNNSLQQLLGARFASGFECIIGPDVTNIGGCFTSMGQLTSITIPNNVTSIGNSAFYGCSNLLKVNSNIDGIANIPNSITNIGNSAFQGCTKLVEITIPNSVISIGDYALADCSNLKILNYDAQCAVSSQLRGLYQKNLQTLVIGNSVPSIGRNVFQAEVNLINVIIGNSVTNIESNAFNNCSSLTNITSLSKVAPTIDYTTFFGVKTNGTLTVPQGSTGYDVWMGTGDHYLGKYGWTKVEQ